MWKLVMLLAILATADLVSAGTGIILNQAEQNDYQDSVSSASLVGVRHLSCSPYDLSNSLTFLLLHAVLLVCQHHQGRLPVPVPLLAKRTREKAKTFRLLPSRNSRFWGRLRVDSRALKLWRSRPVLPKSRYLIGLSIPTIIQAGWRKARKCLMRTEAKVFKEAIISLARLCLLSTSVTDSALSLLVIQKRFLFGR